MAAIEELFKLIHSARDYLPDKIYLEMTTLLKEIEDCYEPQDTEFDEEFEGNSEPDEEDIYPEDIYPEDRYPESQIRTRAHELWESRVRKGDYSDRALDDWNQAELDIMMKHMYGSYD